MQFTIGQNVIHPSHGPGEIVDVTEINLVDGFTNYYVIEFPRQLILHIPIRKSDDLGLRKTMSQAKVENVYVILQSEPLDLPDDYKQRHQKSEALLQSGSPVKVAEVVRDLAWREKSGGLSKIDGDLFSKGKEMLAAEIALVTHRDIHDIHENINLALSKAISAKQTQLGVSPAL